MNASYCGFDLIGERVRNWSWAAGLLALASAAMLAGCNRRPAPNPISAGEADEAQQSLAEEKHERRPAPPPAEEKTWRGYRDWTVAETAVDSLARIGKPSVPTLARTLRHRDAAMRLQAARALARMGSDAVDAVPDLIDALHDRDEQVRKQAVRALGQIGPAAEDAIPALVQELGRAPASPR